jgi:nicotinamidase-related amidase
MEWCKEYTLRLAEGNRFMLCVWPEHCLIGTPGHAVAPVLNEALQYWTGRRLHNIAYLHKGMNNMTEMYSCIQAEVSVETDRTTIKNTELMRKLLTCKRLMICGQASTHSVHFTAVDILHDCPAGHEARMVLLTDAMSPVAGLKEKETEFLTYCKSKGVTLSTTTKVFSVPYCTYAEKDEAAEGLKPLAKNGTGWTDATADPVATPRSSFSFLNMSLFDGRGSFISSVDGSANSVSANSVSTGGGGGESAREGTKD